MLPIHLSCWCCWAPRMYVSIHLSPLKASHLSPSLAGVQSSPLIAIHLSPSVACGVRLSGCLQFMCPPLMAICLPLQQFICLPVWLGVSGSTYVSNSFVSPNSNSFVSQCGWWCPVACGVRLSGCLQFISARSAEVRRQVMRLGAASFCVAGVCRCSTWSTSGLFSVAGAALGASPARFARQAQHLEHLRFVLRGRCSTWSTFTEARGSPATSCLPL